MIGDPIGHSLSPAMHNAAFKKLGIPCTYKAFRVKQGELAAFMQRVRKEFIGTNVTIPHKIEVMKHLDEIDAKAREVGAVNTVVNRDGRLWGFNTDVYGVEAALRSNKVRVAGKKVVVIGAGGAGRAVVAALAAKARELVVTDRNFQKAEELAATAGKHGAAAKAIPLHTLAVELADAGVLVNASPVGMHPHDDETPVAKNLLHPRLVVFDVVYNPRRTRLLREAASLGCRTVSGDWMLAFQGAKAFELFTGRKAPFQTMLAALRKRLR
ncbi:MAG: shikimate dehydrogenase [Candidatus Micrarchaeia archaeon]